MPSQSETISAKRAPLTLAAELNGVELKPQERRAVLAADAMPIRMHKRRVLVAADIFIRDGGFRARDVLGITLDEAVNARDLVRTVPALIALESAHLQLKKPNVAEVAVYKRAKVKHSQIASRLGLEKPTVDRIAENLAELGVNNMRYNTKRFDKFCRQVEEIDSASNGSFLSTSKVAELLTVPIEKVVRARQRNRARHRASTIGKEGLAKVRSFVLMNPSFSDGQIVEELSKNGIEVLQHQVFFQRHLLIVDGQIRPKRRGKYIKDGERVLPTITDQARNELIRLMDIALAQDTNATIVLAEYRKSNPIIGRISVSGLSKIYYQETSRREVPPLKKFAKSSRATHK